MGEASTTRADAATAPESRRVGAARRLTEEVSSGHALDRLAELAARLLGTSQAQVSLMTDVHDVIGAAGLADGADRRRDALADSLCTITTRTAAPFAVPDARADARVSTLPPVTSGLARAYLGVPLLNDDGEAVGALCVFDAQPRVWSSEDVRILEQLAPSVMAELELAALAADFESTRLRWALAVEAAAIGTFDLDVRSGALRWDDRLLELFGYTDGSFDGTMSSFNDRLHPEDLPGVTSDIEGALADCGEIDLEYRIILPDGATRWVQARGRALCDRDGAAVRLIGAAYDATARREGDARLSRALESMSTAFYSLDRQWRFSYVNAEAERLLGRVREELLGASIWEEFPATVGSDFEQTYRDAMGSGEPATVEAYYPAPLDGWYEIRAWPGPDGLAVYFLDITARRHLEDQAALSAARLALVAEVSAEVSAALDLQTAVSRLAELVVPVLADWSVVTLFDDLGRSQVLGSWHVDPTVRPVVAEYARVVAAQLADSPATAERLRASGGTVLRERAGEALRAELGPGAASDLLEVLDPQATAAIALKGRGRTLGQLILASSAGSTHLADGAFTAAEDVATRAGLALDNARLYDQQRLLAEGLQRSLLTEPPAPDHSQVVVRYRPASEMAQVGGDWYDAFLQRSGATVLVIGDVVGHDTAAAGAMGQLRGLLRGIAYHSGAGPADVLSGLDAAMAGLSVATTATAVVARLEQSADQLAAGVTAVRWSNAGHPPPMVIDVRGAVHVLAASEADLLLGIDPTTPRAETVVELERGATLLLYTDGLVERRDQSLDAGLERLREVLDELADRPLEQLCDEVLARLVPDRSEDDVALVAVRLHRQDRLRP